MVTTKFIFLSSMMLITSGCVINDDEENGTYIMMNQGVKDTLILTDGSYSQTLDDGKTVVKNSGKYISTGNTGPINFDSNFLSVINSDGTVKAVTTKPSGGNFTMVCPGSIDKCQINISHDFDLAYYKQ